MVKVKRRMLNELSMKMIEHNAGDFKRIRHMMKVHSFAKLIGESENLDSECLYKIEAASLVHDIGIRASEEKYGDCSGVHQEELGPDCAEEMMRSVGFHMKFIDRVKYLVAHHHTYDVVDGIDHRVLIEADCLVNLDENNATKAEIQAAIENVFQTETGIRICTKMFEV